MRRDEGSQKCGSDRTPVLATRMWTGLSPTGVSKGSTRPTDDARPSNNVQIVQAPGVVVIVNEMVHNARIIPTDGRPHTTLRQWSGDSRGRWEGDTLVVETINFRRETSLQGSARTRGWWNASHKSTPRQSKCEFTVTDPTTYTRRGAR